MTNIFFCAEGEHTLFFLKWKEKKKIGLQPDFGDSVYSTTKDICAFKSAHHSLIVPYDLSNLAERKIIV